MKLLGSTKSKITEDENCQNVSNLEITEVVLTHFNIANIDYQQDSRALIYYLVNYWVFHNFIFLETFNSELSYIEVWFTDQTYIPIQPIDSNVKFNLEVQRFSVQRRGCKKLWIFV